MSAIVCVDCKRELTEHDVVAYVACKPIVGKRQRRVYRHPECLMRRRRAFYDTRRRKVLLAPERCENLTRERTVARLWANSNANEKKLCLALGEVYTSDTRLTHGDIDALLTRNELAVADAQVHGLVRERVDAPLSLDNVQVLPLRDIRDFIQRTSLVHRAAAAAVPLDSDSSSGHDSCVERRLEEVASDD